MVCWIRSASIAVTPARVGKLRVPYRLRMSRYGEEITCGSVLANPLTTDEILTSVRKQCEIVRQPEIQPCCNSLEVEPQGVWRDCSVMAMQ